MTLLSDNTPPMTRKDVERIRKLRERELTKKAHEKPGLRKTFLNIGKAMFERHSTMKEQRKAKNAMASFAKGLAVFIGVVGLLSALGFVGAKAFKDRTPEMAKLTKASSEDSEKALAASKNLVEAAELSPERLRKLCPRLDDERALDLKDCLERAGMPLFEKATANVPKFDTSLCYVSVPACGGSRLHLAFRKTKDGMSVEGFNLRR